MRSLITLKRILPIRRQYDLIIAVNGYYPLSVYKRALRPNGRYVMIGGPEALKRSDAFCTFCTVALHDREEENDKSVAEG